jgi:hypothetical protein
MRHSIHCVIWGHRAYRFERFSTRRGAETSEWAVCRGLEFIGTMSCSADLTTGEFDVRCSAWLTDLLGRSRA